ncbi:SURF1 family protein [soil metagenome]
MGFLLSRRWVLFALAVTVLAVGSWWLGEWQFDRLEERQRANARVERNLELEPVPVAEVLEVGRAVDESDEWRRIRAVGVYEQDQSVIVRYQTRDGASGVDVVTPLKLAATGAALLVDRGWLATDNAGSTDVEVPAAPAGTVTVVGWVRADATGDSVEVADQSTRAISSVAVGEALGEPVYGGFVDLVEEQPAPAQPLTKAEPPDLGQGPHFFYGLQWWFFAALAVFGFGYLAFDERRKAQLSVDQA